MAAKEADDTQQTCILLFTVLIVHANKTFGRKTESFTQMFLQKGFTCCLAVLGLSKRLTIRSCMLYNNKHMGGQWPELLSIHYVVHGFLHSIKNKDFYSFVGNSCYG